MSRLPFEAFLALRYLRPRRTFVSVITVISIIGVMLGVAVLIIVISVMSGFDQEWRKGIFGFNSHVKIYGANNHNIPNYEKLLPAVAATPDVAGVSPFIKCQVMIKTQPEATNDYQVAAPLMMGVDQETFGKVSILPNSIVEGQYDLSGDGMLIGREFADQYDLRVGNRLAVYSAGSIKAEMDRRNGDTNATRRIADEFIIRGIFDVGFADYNASVVVISLERAEELNSLADGTVQGLQLKLTDPFKADAVSEKLRAVMGENYVFQTWREENSHIFDALASEKNTMFFLLFFIMIVAAFGIVNCQITFVVQKTREIGILKALGAGRRQILLLFLSQSVIVGVLGVGLGLALALSALHYRNGFLHLLRQVTHQEILPSSIYHLYELPASTQTSDVIFICVTAFLTCVLAGIFPAWKASRLQPVEALRHE